MKFVTLFLLIAAFLLVTTPAAADQKYFPGQAGNDNVEVRAEMLIDAATIKDAVGSDLGEGYVVARVTTTNKTGEPLHVGPADFTAVSRKDGDRGDPLEPGQIAGGSTLVLKTNHAGREYAQQHNTPGWVGVAGTKSDKPVDQALLTALTSKQFPDQDLKPNESATGLLYFSIQTKKLKTKDLSLLYKGPAGHLSVDFK